MALTLDGERRVLKLTLGALAELEAELATGTLVDLVERFESGAFSSRDVLALMDRETDPKVRAQLASRAKARAVTAAKRITRDAIQLHGAVGYTDEFDIGLYLNRALVLSAWLGDDAYHRRIWFDAREAEGAAQ